MIVTYNAFQLWTKSSPSAIILKVTSDHVIVKLHTTMAAESHHTPCFMKMSTVMQVIIYYQVSAHLFAGRQGMQKWSH